MCQSKDWLLVHQLSDDVHYPQCVGLARKQWDLMHVLRCVANIFTFLLRQKHLLNHFNPQRSDQSKK